MIFHCQHYYTPHSFRENIKEFDAAFHDWFGSESLLVHIALTECFNNAWEHGNLMDESKPVIVYIKEGRTRVYLRIEDKGAGYCFKDAVLPADSDSLLEKERGRGLFIIQNTVDWALTDQAGTTTLMIKRKVTK
ncbi:ATP-binding protein [Salisediminibacterium halotolerans]|uniref:ATP-binding protein n=1 Tax=Salisediminibacterium halotolerans TaxID=517425 RepID=UPI000EAE8D1F|nr:ATP-binding protein [Salisediminibacterium halotolerans]RLJ75427.1 serine/threonine-protein kinase RsbW [Actinophytocola xinjiangensis]RPE89280.1 serine/threonine-protein kinase RsbW [Salisediminibacterium halotolerans]TWG36040.1 serine/threonine-protein kinase RsbW [Salisediminibacterium halotolerans]GEL07497.1 hypothetical protein SHA02_09130 [Salisediminibacterium halotolerans]